MDLGEPLTILRVLTAAARRLSRGALSRSTSRIARLIRMPLSFTMITKLYITAWTLAVDAWARSAPGSDDSVATVRRRAPARIGISKQDASHHKVFVFRYHIRMCLEQRLDVAWVHGVSALWTSNVRSRLGDFDREIALEANAAGGVLARRQRVHVISLIVFHVAQLALLWVLSGLLCSDRWGFVAALRRGRLLHKHEGDPIDMTRRGARALWCGVVVVVLKREKMKLIRKREKYMRFMTNANHLSQPAKHHWLWRESFKQRSA